MKVVLLIGISGSGKSFFSTWLKRRWPCEVIFSDNEKEHIWGSRLESTDEASVLKEMLERCRSGVLAGHNVILDTTYFNTLSNRQVLYTHMAGCEVEFIAIKFPIGIAECAGRNAFHREGRNVEIDVVKHQAAEVELPIQGECRCLMAYDTSVGDVLGIEPRRRLEILAPAGNKEQLKAAVKAGCDAVYGGLRNWNARGRAGNFSPMDYCYAIHFCHEAGVKFYLTLNTLVRDDEIAAIINFFSCGEVPLPDAFIVADIGLMTSLSTAFPSVPLHVSTQGGTATAEDARFYHKMGASRLILARELSIAEIANICEVSDLEIEVFAYGSQCVAFSGQCMWGALLHGCSGNRGRCIGMCRDDYESNGQIGNYFYPRDLSAFSGLERLSACGVSSIKIEGRMRRPEEIADAVTAFREGDNLELVEKLGGNYQGFLEGGTSPDMFSAVNPRGRKSAKVCVTRAFSDLQPNVSLKAICDNHGALTGFDFIDNKGGRNVINIDSGRSCSEKMSVTELANLISRNISANVYEFTSDRGAEERIVVSMAGLQKAMGTMNAICNVKLSKQVEHVDFSPKRSLCSVSSLVQLKMAMEFGFSEFVMPWQGEEVLAQALGMGERFSIAWELPTVDFTHPMSAIVSVLGKHRQDVVISRISQLEALGRGFEGDVILGFGGNIWNFKTMEALKTYNVTSAFLSPELPICEYASKITEIGIQPIVSYWGRLPIAVSRGCFKAVGICNGECHGQTGRLRNIGKGYDVNLFCDELSNTRVLVPSQIFFAGNKIGMAKKCVSFKWMDNATVSRCLHLNAEGGLKAMQNIYSNTQEEMKDENKIIMG